MGDDNQDGILTLLKAQQKRRDAVGRCAIEIPRRLIAQEQPRTANKRSRKGHTLLFPSGKLGRNVIDSRTQPDLLDERTRMTCGVGIGRADERRHQHILEDGALRQQTVILKNESDLFVAEGGEGFGRQLEWILALEVNGTGCRRLERTKDIEERALPSPGRSHDGSRIAGRK